MCYTKKPIAQPILLKLGTCKGPISRLMTVGYAWMGTFLRLRDICAWQPNLMPGGDKVTMAR